MNNTASNTSQNLRAALLASVLLLSASDRASAVQMNVVVTTIAQFGTGSGFYVGHTIVSSSNYNNLTTGGTFTAECNSPATLPVTGERTLSSNGFGGIGPNRLTTTVPETVPSLRNMTGWAQVTQGTTLSCNYRWTARAVEGGYSLSIPGVAIPIGGGQATEGNTVDFTMTRPGGGNGGGCIP